MNHSNGRAEESGAATPTEGRLPRFGVLRFAGPDALAFLQGQLSNDTRRLAEGRPLLAAYSTPQGRVIAVMHLLPHSSGAMAILPRELALPTALRLRKYVLRAKVRIEDVSDQFTVSGGIGAHPSGSLPAADGAGGYAERDGIGVARVGADRNRYWVIGTAADPASDPGAGGPAADSPLEHSWRLADIRCGLPQIYAATCEMFVAQMLNLDLLDGISFTKGCFTGQEIIARTQHLGRIKRRLHRLRLPAGTWAIGQPLHLADGRSGRLTDIAAIGPAFEALAVLTREPGGSTAGEGPGEAADRAALVDAVELPLPYPLDAA